MDIGEIVKRGLKKISGVGVQLLLLKAKIGIMKGLAFETISAVWPDLVIAIIPSASIDSAIFFAAMPRYCQSVSEISLVS